MLATITDRPTNSPASENPPDIMREYRIKPVTVMRAMNLIRAYRLGFAGSKPSIRWRTLRIQMKLTTAMRPPAKTPRPIFLEKKTKPAKVRIANSVRLPLMMMDKRLSSLIAIIIPVDLPASNHVDILEASRDANKHENIKEPRCCPKPAIKRQTKPNTNRDSQYD